MSYFSHVDLNYLYLYGIAPALRRFRRKGGNELYGLIPGRSLIRKSGKAAKDLAESRLGPLQDYLNALAKEVDMSFLGICDSF